MKKIPTTCFRSICIVLSLFLLFCSFIFPSSAAYIPGISSGETFSIINVATGEAIDVPGGNKVSEWLLFGYPYSPLNPWQKWKFISAGSGTYNIVDMNSGNLLSIAGSSPSEGASAWNYRFDDTAGQRFRIEYNNDETVSFLSQCSNYTMALYIDESNGQLKQTAYTGADNQKFKLVIPGYVYNIQNVNSGKSLDVSGGGTANGNDVAQYTTTEDCLWQRWSVRYVGDDLYKIMDMNSGKLLSIAGSSAEAGANCHIWAEDGTDGQLFKIRRNMDDTYTFLSKCSNYTMALGVWDSHTENGYSFVQLPVNSSNNLRFTMSIVDKSQSPDGFYRICNGSITNYLTATTTNSVIPQTYATGNDNQLWNVSFDADGYYKIINMDTGKYLSAANSFSNGSSVTVSDAFTTAVDILRQRWKITIKENGKVELQSRYHAEYEVNGGTRHLLSLSNAPGTEGSAAVHRNDGYLVQWVLDRNCGLFYDVLQTGIEKTMNGLGYAKQALDSSGEFGFILTESFDPVTCKEHLGEVKYFVSISHGRLYQRNDIYTTTSICLGENESGDLCGSTSGSQAQHYISESDIFKNLEIAIFAGCNTAKDTAEWNICEAVVRQGAKFAIGFEEEVADIFAYGWIKVFFENLAAGKTVDFAFNAATVDINELIQAFNSNPQNANYQAPLMTPAIFYG